MHNNYYSGLLIKIIYTVFYAWCKETSRVIWFLWLLALYTDYVIYNPGIRVYSAITHLGQGTLDPLAWTSDNGVLWTKDYDGWIMMDPTFFAPFKQQKATFLLKRRKKPNPSIFLSRTFKCVLWISLNFHSRIIHSIPPKVADLTTWQVSASNVEAQHPYLRPLGGISQGSCSLYLKGMLQWKLQESQVESPFMQSPFSWSILWDAWSWDWAF